MIDDHGAVAAERGATGMSSTLTSQRRGRLEQLDWCTRGGAVYLGDAKWSKTWFHASVSLYTATRRRWDTGHVLMAC